MKKIVLIIVFLLILIAIPLTVFLVRQRQDIRQRAEPATVLYIEPQSTTVREGDTFTVEVKADTATNAISAVELHLNFSALYLEVVSMVPGSFLPDSIIDPEIGAGNASIIVQVPTSHPIPRQVNGVGTVAVVTFKALQTTDTPTEIVIASNSRVAPGSETEDAGNDVLLARQPGQVTITSATGASPAPSAIPGGASPTPGVSPSIVPSATPRATPAVSPSPTGTQRTQINAPISGATVTTRRPTFSGVSFPNALMVLTISNTQISENFTANANGNWSFIPTTDLANGSYTVTVTGTVAGSASPETDTLAFTVSVGGTGGTGVASPSPTPMAPATTTPATGGTGTTVASPASSSSQVPVTGNETPTLILLGMAILLVLFGSTALLWK